MLVEIAWKSTVILALAWIAVLLLRRVSSAAVRHVVWTAASCLILALPVLIATLPVVDVPVRAELIESSWVLRTKVRAAGELPAAAVGAVSPVGAAAATRPWNWQRLFTAIWAMGGLIGLLRLALSWAAVERLRRRSVAFAHPEADDLRLQLGLRRSVDLRTATGVGVPMVWDSVRPVVLLPAEALEWTAERLRVVLLHEFAHVRRGDLWTHAMARLATLVYWWNPLAWIAWREFLRERERATDDLVLRMGTNGPDYAGHLLEIARSMRGEVPVAVAMIRRSELEDRMMAILDTKTNRGNAGAAVVAGVLAAALAVGVPLAAMQAQSGGGSVLAGVENGSELIRMGHKMRAEAKPAEARASYQKALEKSGSKAEGIEALIALGVMAFHDKDLATAEDYFSKAQLLDPLEAGKATMWMAMVRDRQERFTEAESLLQAALSTQKAESLASVVTMELYGYLLKKLGREDEAKATMERAQAIRKRVEPQVYLAAERGTPSLRIGGGVQAPKLLSKVEPQYTDEARAARYEGTVVVKVEILTDGTARNAQVLRGLAYGLNEHAVEAIGQWRFQPGTKGGQPVPVAATIEVNYRLL